MKKRFLIISVITLLIISIAIPSLAMENVANGIRNFVGGTENTIENVGNNVAGGIKNGLNTIGHGAENVVTDVRDGMGNTQNTMMGTTTGDNNNGRYTATRTSADEARLAGMTTSTWSWIIVGITIAAIGLLIWAYMRQKNENDIYIDSDEL